MQYETSMGHTIEIIPISLAQTDKPKFMAVRAVAEALGDIDKIEDQNSPEAWQANDKARDALEALCNKVQVDPGKVSFADVPNLISILQTGDVIPSDPPETSTKTNGE